MFKVHLWLQSIALFLLTFASVVVLAFVGISAFEVQAHGGNILSCMGGLGGLLAYDVAWKFWHRSLQNELVRQANERYSADMRRSRGLD